MNYGIKKIILTSSRPLDISEVEIIVDGSVRNKPSDVTLSYESCCDQVIAPVDEKPCLNKGSLLNKIDAMNWAKEFIETFSDPLSKEIQHWKIDENLMHSWFANAIMTGYDFAKRQMKNKENSVTDSSSIIEPINTGQLPHYNPLAHQEGGDHYKKFPIQPIEFCQRNKLGACETSAVKYLCRHKYKGGASDIKKAIHYLQILLETEYGTNRSNE